MVPEHNRMRWPLCYVACIIEMFKPRVDNNLLSPLTDCFSSLQFYSTQTDSGKDWEVIIEIALLFRFYANKFSNFGVPLNLLSRPQQAADVQYISIPGELNTLGKARTFIKDKVAVCIKSTLILFVPLLNSFPVFDGFAVFTECDNGGRRTIISGYQAKKGRPTPTAAVPAWVNGGGWLLRGRAAGTQHRPESGWTYMTQQDICDDILGYSLAPIYPAIANW